MHYSILRLHNAPRVVCCMILALYNVPFLGLCMHNPKVLYDPIILRLCTATQFVYVCHSNSLIIFSHVSDVHDRQRVNSLKHA